MNSNAGGVRPPNDGVAFLKRLVLMLASLVIFVGVGWSFVGIFAGTWEESNGLYPLQRSIHDGEPITLAAIGGIICLLVFAVVGVFGMVRCIRR